MTDERRTLDRDGLVRVVAYSFLAAAAAALFVRMRNTVSADTGFYVLTLMALGEVALIVSTMAFAVLDRPRRVAQSAAAALLIPAFFLVDLLLMNMITDLSR